MKAFSMGLAAASLSALASQAQVYFPTTGSFYDVVVTKVTWTDARNLAESSFCLGTQGRLATITSQAENDFVLNSVIGTLGDTFWLGAYQPDGANVAPDEGWEWITGELWDYTNWRQAGGTENEPNDFAGGEHSLEILNASFGEFSGTWNDLNDANVTLSEGYVIEYVIPEPTTFALLGLGSLALVMVRQRK